MANTLKVSIPVTVEIDVEAWCREYGCTPSEVRADVKRAVTSDVWAQLDSLGVLA